MVNSVWPDASSSSSIPLPTSVSEIAREVELFAAEEVERHRRLPQFGVDLALQLGVGEHVAVDKGVFDFLFRGISDERVAAADVEVDVGERVEAEVGVVFVHVHHGDHLEEETESRDFRGLVHDVHAVEVAEASMMIPCSVNAYGR